MQLNLMDLSWTKKMAKDIQKEQYKLAEIFLSVQNDKKRAKVCWVCGKLLHAIYGRALCSPLKVFRFLQEECCFLLPFLTQMICSILLSPTQVLLIPSMHCSCNTLSFYSKYMCLSFLLPILTWHMKSMILNPKSNLIQSCFIKLKMWPFHKVTIPNQRNKANMLV